jgi:hypothetical protein
MSSQSEIQSQSAVSRKACRKRWMSDHPAIKNVEMLTAQLKEQAAQIQKVSAQIKTSQPAPHVVVSGR